VASPFADRAWAVESADGLGELLSQQLVAEGEHVIDVPATLAAKVRLLGSTKASKNDPNDALSTAIAGLRHCGLRQVVADDHRQAIRMLVRRFGGHRSTAPRRCAGCTPCSSSSSPADCPANSRPISPPLRCAGSARTTPSTWPRKAIAAELVLDVRRCDRELVELRQRIVDAVDAVRDDAVLVGNRAGSPGYPRISAATIGPTP
jgi:hypothetical protein